MNLKPLILAALPSFAVAASAQTPQTPVDSKLYSGLVWRNIGPFRGGRVSAVSGVIGQPGVFYAGMPGGGVWKTTNAGITWASIFDSIPNASSVGAVQVAPSDPNTVYVGLGDGTTGGGHSEGDGVYKSTDAGKSWAHMGLDFAKQIPRIFVDPHDPNVVVAAVLGDFHKPGPNRGAYRSTDGGKSWTRTLITDNVTGVQDLAWALDNPQVILAATNRHCAPLTDADRAEADKKLPNAVSGTVVVKSMDGGVTWSKVKGEGLPGNMNGRTSVAVAMNTNSQRMFFVSNSGLWRSDDGGDSWKQMDREDNRVRNGQGGYNCGVYVNSKDPDTVYVLNTCSYISHDGGKSFTGFKGAPGGDDPQQMWIDPNDGKRLFLGVDQGPTVSLDGGATWSPWYNIANGQFYHIGVSNTWPYWVYANMQDSGAIGMSSRGNYGEITPLDWSPNPGWEWGSIAVDPLNPNVIYSTGQANDVIRESFPTGQYLSVSPDNDPKLKLRHNPRAQPIMFSPANPHELLLGYQFLMSSTDGGRTWHKISPDLSFPKGYVPPKPEDDKKDAKKAAPKPATSHNEEVGSDPDEQVAGDDDADADDDGDQNISPKDLVEHEEEMEAKGQRGGAGFVTISSLSPSSIDNGIIWAGISNGAVKLTQDHGKSWDDVNIPDNKSSIESIDSSHTNRAEAYVAVHSTSEPLIYRTKDFGKTWTKIVAGLPSDETTGSWVNVIRADTKKSGLIFAGTESSVYVSFDDGDHWQPLKLNSPNTSYRDMVIKDNDLVVGTYGRSFWILDDISPLRQLTAPLVGPRLFVPGDAIRVRRNVNQDTPMPPEVPHSLNAPSGAILYYYLPSKPGSLTIDITDAAGAQVRHYSSEALPAAAEELQPIPDFWKEVPKPLPTELGTNRVNWDLRYENPPSFSHDYDISATPFLTPAGPFGPLVPPGIYNVTLTVDGNKMTQKVTVKNDPRSPGSPSDLRDEHRYQMELYQGATAAMAGILAVRDLKAKIADCQKGNPPKDAAAALSALSDKLDSIGGPTGRGRGGPGGGFGFNAGGSTPSFGSIQGQSISYLNKLEWADFAPSQPMKSAIDDIMKQLDELLKGWQEIKGKEVPAVNQLLSKDGLTTITIK